MRVVIMRGVPGSGKSFWVNSGIQSGNLPSDTLVLSTDNYFMVDGCYTFDRNKLPEYHNRTLLEFLIALRKCIKTIVVDNTNIKTYEIAPYVRLAEAFGYEVEIVWVMASPEICKARNQHGVPPAIIDSMICGAEVLPPWWKIRVIVNS